MRYKAAGKLKNYIEFEYVLVIEKDSTSKLFVDESKVAAESGNNHELVRILGESEYKGKLCMIEPYSVRSVSHKRMEKDVWLLPEDAIVGVIELDPNDKVVGLEEYVKAQRSGKLNLTNTPKLATIKSKLIY